MAESRPGDQGGQIPQDRYQDSEAQLGGADAVEKTSYVLGQGTSPEARRAPGTPAPAARSRTPSVMVWLVVALVAIVVIGYAAGWFR